MYYFKFVIGMLILISIPSNVQAYIGPGLGLGVLGAIIGVIAAVFLAFIGMLWYPIKRFILRKTSQANQGKDADSQ